MTSQDFEKVVQFQMQHMNQQENKDQVIKVDSNFQNQIDEKGNTFLFLFLLLFKWDNHGMTGYWDQSWETVI